MTTSSTFSSPTGSTAPNSFSSSTTISSSTIPHISPLYTTSAAPSHIQQTFAIKLQNKDNYAAWKQQFTPLLNIYNLTNLINGKELAPSPTIVDPATSITLPNPDYSLWFQKDQIVLSWLLSSITENVYPLINGLTSAHYVWHALEVAFGIVSHAQKTQLLIEFHNLNKGDTPIFKFLYRAKALADCLIMAGHPMTTDEFNALVFRKLGAEFNGIVGALQQRPVAASFPELHGQLVAHELLLKAQQPDIPLANTAQYNPRPQSFLPNPGRGRGGNRGRRGYFNNSVSCQICGLNNHLLLLVDVGLNNPQIIEHHLTRDNKMESSHCLVKPTWHLIILVLHLSTLVLHLLGILTLVLLIMSPQILLP